MPEQEGTCRNDSHIFKIDGIGDILSNCVTPWIRMSEQDGITIASYRVVRELTGRRPSKLGTYTTSRQPGGAASSSGAA